MQNAIRLPNERHVYGLDVLRCVAAVLVAGFHFTRKLDGMDQVFPFGWVGVEIFFLISGYVISRSAQHGDAARFLKSRFLRLYPAAWIVALVSGTILAVVPSYYWRHAQISVFPDLPHVLNSLLLTGMGMSASYWTLAVELAFYLCVFLLLLAGRAWWLRHFAIPLTLYATPYIVALALHHLRITHTPFVEFGLSGWNALLLRHGPFFALGLFLCFAAGAGLRMREKCAAGLALLLCLMEIACRAAEQLHGQAISDLVQLPWLIVEAETAFVVALVAMMVFLRRDVALPGRLRPLARSLGRATYPFYLAHEILGGLTIYWLLRLGAGPGAAVAGGFVMVLAVACFITERVEPAFRRIIRGIIARRGDRDARPAANLGAA